MEGVCEGIGLLLSVRLAAKHANLAEGVWLEMQC